MPLAHSPPIKFQRKHTVSNGDKSPEVRIQPSKSKNVTCNASSKPNPQQSTLCQHSHVTLSTYSLDANGDKTPEVQMKLTTQIPPNHNTASTTQQQGSTRQQSMSTSNSQHLNSKGNEIPDVQAPQQHTQTDHALSSSSPQLRSSQSVKRMNKALLNLSHSSLTAHDERLLTKGLSFIPRYKSINPLSVYNAQNRITRLLKLKDYFMDSVSDVNRLAFTQPSSWTPKNSMISEQTAKTISDIIKFTERTIKHRFCGDSLSLRPSPDNLSRDERASLTTLRNDPSIIIKPADKGSTTVLMNREDYILEASSQLEKTQYYTELPSPIFTATVPRLNEILTRMLHNGSITQKQYDFLQASTQDRPRRFYTLPKIHKSSWFKPNIPHGRPIVSDSSSESIRIAQFIDSFLRPLGSSHKAYIKDTYDFVNNIRGCSVPPGAFLVTGDVSSLYTNMRHDRIMRVTREALSRTSCPGRDDESLLELLDLTLRSNDFQFNGRTFLQTCGTAMGKPYAPSLANIYLQELDDKMVAYTLHILLYFRFIDDIFFVWTGTEQQLINFNKYINSLIEGIEIKLTWSTTSINFLDTTIYKSNVDTPLSTLMTKVYFKETDNHLLLHPDSFHPRHTRMGVLKSQFIRFKRISSSRTDYDEASSILMKALGQRKYSLRHMRHMKLKVWYSTSSEKPPDIRPLLPIVIPYNDIGCTLAKGWSTIIRRNDLFSNHRIVKAYTKGKSLSDTLTHSLLKPQNQDKKKRYPQPRKRKWKGCGQCTSKRCSACSFISPSSTFRSSVNRKIFKVRGSMNCRSSNLIYLITCKLCNMQYVGETSRTLADRINDHLSAIRCHKDTPVSQHFNSGRHRYTHFRCTGIQVFPKQTPSSTRRLMESTWQDILQTGHPLGFNCLPTKFKS